MDETKKKSGMGTASPTVFGSSCTSSLIMTHTFQTKPQNSIMELLQSRLRCEFRLLHEDDPDYCFKRQLSEVHAYSRSISRRDAKFLREQGIPVEVIARIKEYIACEQIDSIVTEYFSKKKHSLAQKAKIRKQLGSILEDMERQLCI